MIGLYKNIKEMLFGLHSYEMLKERYGKLSHCNYGYVLRDEEFYILQEMVFESGQVHGVKVIGEYLPKDGMTFNEWKQTINIGG